MICVSIGNCSAEECIDSISELELAEIRIDSMDLSEQDIEKIFSTDVKLIATCRTSDLEKKKQLLEKAIESGASYVDVEVECNEKIKKEIISKAKEKGCKVIVSYHNYKKTPNRVELEHVINWCEESGADLVKIACTVNSEQDSARLLGLLDSSWKSLIVVGMGEKGKLTRITASLLGSVFSYASLGKNRELAPGQISKEELEKIIKVLKHV